MKWRPLLFEPIFQERVWGGRNLQSLYQKSLPEGRIIGESWEISDRPEAASRVRNGAFKGKDLHWLTTNHPRELVGPNFQGSRFPLLIKILDAQQTLSLQVHPPDRAASRLGGEPKTEMWYVTQAAEEAVLYAGLKRGVRREDFERLCRDGSVAECFHRIPVRAGDCMFLPSGRVHAIGAGLVLFEIQQNSDTTYRVFDWNRAGLDGRPRQLHLDQSLESIDFDDYEPSLVHSEFQLRGSISIRPLVRGRHFEVDAARGAENHEFRLDLRGRCCILAVVKGGVQLEEGEDSARLRAGEFALIPAAMGDVSLRFIEEAEFLLASPGEGG